MNGDIEIHTLTPLDAPVIAELIRAQPPDYVRFFYALGSDESEIVGTLAKAERDLYSGVYMQKDLIGMFMLRGWDQGYDIPSFGVLIDANYRGRTLLRLTLETAKNICRLNGSTKLMAKIHPENVSPRGASRLGLYQTGLEEATGNIIYHLDL